MGQSLLAVQRSRGATVDTQFMDSGASDHMTHRKDWFMNYKPQSEIMYIKIGDGAFLEGHGRGSINILVYDGQNWTEKHISDVVYVPKLRYNLFSAGVTIDKSMKLEADNTICRFPKL